MIFFLRMIVILELRFIIKLQCNVLLLVDYANWKSPEHYIGWWILTSTTLVDYYVMTNDI